jgi:hypothetical protein
LKFFQFIAYLLLFQLIGCMGNNARNAIDPDQLDVFGITMHSSTDYREIRGIKGVDEPCLRGYDRSFDALDIVIGYNNDGSIRRITTHNPQNSLFGVHPGETVASAFVKIREAGLVASDSPYRFRKEGISLRLLADESGKIFGMSIETADMNTP